MQYFGYLHRNPDEGPDHDFSGFNFWLDKLNTFGGDFHRAEMVSILKLNRISQTLRMVSPRSTGSRSAIWVMRSLDARNSCLFRAIYFAGAVFHDTSIQVAGSGITEGLHPRSLKSEESIRHFDLAC